MSIAPEIAKLAEPGPDVPARKRATAGAAAALDDQGPQRRLTLGALARELRTIAATPEQWWGLVRFDPDRPVLITVQECASHVAWLVVLPPGEAGHGCDCDVATVVAGEVAEGTAEAAAVLRPGTLRVHGQPHRLRGTCAAYSISLHARARSA